MDELINNILAILDNKLIRSLIVVLIALAIQKIIKYFIRKTFEYTVESSLYPKRKRDQEKRAKTLVSVSSAICTMLTWTIAIIVIMSIYNLDISTILVSAGFMGAAIAFGAQSSIRDFVNGFFMIVENQYRIDDYVQFDDLKGRVENISIRITDVRDEEGKLHHVPNGSIIVTTNMSMGDLNAHEQIDISSKISINEFEEKLQKIAESIVNDSELSKIIKSGPKLVRIDKISKSATTITICFHTTASKRQQAATAVWKQLIEQKIPLV